MKNVTFLIGLPGSGKTTLIKHYLNHPFLEFKVYDDWSTGWKSELKFYECAFYPSLVKDIKENKNIIISTIDFCNNEYLIESENHLKSEFKDIKIKRIYWENNLDASIKNIYKRDKERGGHYKWCDEKKENWYYGLHYDGKAQFKWEIEWAEKLSKVYTIPSNYSTFPIKT